MQKIEVVMLLYIIVGSFFTVVLPGEPCSAASFVEVDDEYDASTPGWGITHFASIQAGVDTVDEEGTVYVHSGTYEESVIINKSISLLGENKNGVIVTSFKVEADGVSLNGFTTLGRSNVGIYISGSNNCSIKNCVISAEDGHGIGLLYSANTTIDSNIIRMNNIGIIDIFGSDYHNITNNEVYSNTNEGIVLAGSDYCTIENNEVYSNANGIVLSTNAADNIIVRNAVYSNTHHGLFLISSHQNDIRDNNITQNEHGIYIEGPSNNNVITGNDVTLNSLYGIYIESATKTPYDNVIYDNFFQNTNNAFDPGTNSWNIDKTSGVNKIAGPYLGGNYWDDYEGIDTNGDGLGETLYPISGGDSTDELPLVNPNYKPTADTGGPYSGKVNETIVFDGSGSDDVDGSIVSYRWDFGDGGSGSGVSPAHTYSLADTYTVTLTVTDDQGATHTDSTTITIQEEVGVNLDGWVTGTVCDDAGYPLAGAQVCILLSGVENKCRFTDEEGLYRVMVLAGTYIAEVSKEGYESFRTETAISPDATTRLDVMLERVADSSEIRGDLNEQLLQEKISTEVRNNKLGAKIIVRPDEETISYYSDGLTIELDSGDEVISLTISADDGVSGTILVIRIGEGVLSDLDTLEVTYDGEPINESTDVDEFFDLEGNSDTGWLRALTTTGLYIFVRVPHFSEHEITIRTIIAEVVEGLSGITAVVVYIVMCAVALVVFTGSVIIRRRL